MRAELKRLLARFLQSRKKTRGIVRTSSVLRLASSSSITERSNAAASRMILVQELGMDSNPAAINEDICTAAADDNPDSFHSCRSSIASGANEYCDSDRHNDQAAAAAVADVDEDDGSFAESIRSRLMAPSDLRIYAVTWNMNGKIPYDCLPELLEHGRGEYDMYVIGVQESPVSSLRRMLHPILGKQYSLVAKSVMGSLQLYVFGKCWLHHHISGKKVDKVRFKGFGAVLGRQKGAVAASFCLGSTSLLFIASHFAAHEKKVNERNVQYLRTRKKIFSRPKTTAKFCMGNAPIRSEPTDLDEQARPGANFMDKSDVVVWLGDLNYRIEGSRGLVKSFIRLNLEKLLWRRDQLFNAVDKGEVFNGFVEGPLMFKPTYKYDIGTDNYDTSEKERVPSWTDRILIKVRDESSLMVHVENYYSIDALRTSDHRPVKALLRVGNLN